MLSSTMRPTAMARPDRLMEFNVQSKEAIATMVVIMLRGMEMPMMAVGRRVLRMPRITEGRIWSMKRKMASTAMAKPSIPCPVTGAQLFFQPRAEVGQHPQPDVRRQFQGVDDRQQFVGHGDGVALRQTEDAQRHAGLTVGAGDGGGFRSVDHHLGHVRYQDWGRAAARRRVAANESDGNGADGVQVAVAVIGAQGDGPVPGAEGAGAEVDGVDAHGVGDVLDGQAVFLQQRRVNDDRDPLTDAALNLNVIYTVNGLHGRAESARQLHAAAREYRAGR